MNYQRVTEGFQILTEVLAPYVARELRARFDDEWWGRGVLAILRDIQKRELPAGGEDDDLIPTLDAACCLLLLDVQWKELFRRKLRREHLTWVKELRATRNKWAHRGLLDMADEDAWRALDTMTRLVEPMDSEATERLRALARTVRYGAGGPSTTARGPEDDERAAGHRGKDRAGVLAAVPRQGLEPWREIARPHPDVAAGRYRPAESAADLSRVARGPAEVEYRDPVEFFARTRLTEGIRNLETSSFTGYPPARRGNAGTLPVELVPSSESDFKRELLRQRHAWIVEIYRDGRRETRRWKADRMSESSHVKGNIRSRPQYRKGAWEKSGLERLIVSIHRDDPPPVEEDDGNLGTSGFTGYPPARRGNAGTLPVELVPSSESDFKRELLRQRYAWIVEIYRDGRRETRRWNAARMSKSSHVKGNLRSRPQYRRGAWEKSGLERLIVSIHRDDPSPVEEDDGNLGTSGFTGYPPARRWGPPIRDPSELPVRRHRFDDGPPIPVEFAR